MPAGVAFASALKHAFSFKEAVGKAAYEASHSRADNGRQYQKIGRKKRRKMNHFQWSSTHSSFNVPLSFVMRITIVFGEPVYITPSIVITVDLL